MSGTADEMVPTAAPAEFATLSARLPELFLAAKSSERFWEFFAANIRNKNTRRAYYKAACQFSDWCEGRGLHKQQDRSYQKGRVYKVSRCD